jgi:heme A synthase
MFEAFIVGLAIGSPLLLAWRRKDAPAAVRMMVAGSGVPMAPYFIYLMSGHTKKASSGGEGIPFPCQLEILNRLPSAFIFALLSICACASLGWILQNRQERGLFCRTNAEPMLTLLACVALVLLLWQDVFA